jgi:myosin protein heavy chain
MAAKSSEDNKRLEVDKSREAEMARLREEVIKLQKTLDEQREGAQQLANKLKVDVEALRQSHTAAQRELKTVQGTLKDKEAELAKVQSTAQAVENEKRKVEADLAGVRDQLKSTDEKLQATVSAREVSAVQRSAERFLLMTPPAPRGPALTGETQV